ncbi:hypothetical protein KC19_3G154800 [Ceratodon purpureus]|uniref:Uncharacterized protein n=1 Tax=Ceratodon purpureus TaxID=3225 RepID=A0A8T0IIQ3_CERPU|nr:hypothetical protein KC19_3G154800 [Ceratodon purpureus]
MLLGCSKILRHSTGTTKIQAAMFGYEHPILSEVRLISITCGSAHQLIFKVLLILIIVFFELYLFAMLMNGDYLAKCFSFFNCMVLVNRLFSLLQLHVLLSFKALATSVTRCGVTSFYSTPRAYCWIQYWKFCIG